jgi:hypothetical protein
MAATLRDALREERTALEDLLKLAAAAGATDAR